MPIGREDHQERKEHRISSYEEKAAKANREAVQQDHRARELGSAIPFGQPIMIGHHSEKKHRALVNKIESASHRSAEAQDRADYYQDKAETAAGNNAISGDDPEAANLYKEKLEKLEHSQERMKIVNAYWRKHKTMNGYPGISDTEAAKIDEQMKTAYSWIQKSVPYADFMLRNNSAEIRRIKEKLDALEKLDGMTAETIKFSGGEMRVNTDINRVQFIFDSIPSEDIRSFLKSRGFKWAHSEGAWQRQRTVNAVIVARRLISEISKLEAKA